MSTPTLHADAGSLERRKQVKIRLRPDLIIGPHKYEGRTYYVVKDPVALRYYRFKEHEHFLLSFLDGKHSLEDGRKAFEQRFRPERLTLEDLEAFTHQLLQAGLAQNETPGMGKQLFTRYKKRRRSKFFQTFMNVFYIKIPIFDPDKILEKMKPIFGFIFTKSWLMISIGIMLAALFLVLTHWNTFVAKMPAFHEFFSLKTIASLWIALGAVKVVHEFGHGLSCKMFGGEVHEMGALFLVFSPCLYCNVSDAWTLPNKWHRIVIGAAGIYVELIIAAIATFIWWNTESGTMLNNLSMALMVVCSVSTFVFNANPLMRFDGYYVLADWLEIPNLREKSNKYLSEVVQKHCLGIEVPPQAYMTRGRQILFITYAVVSWVYRWFVTFSILWFMFNFLEPYKLGAISFILGMISVGTMIGTPLYKLGKSIHRRGRIPDMKPVRVAISAAVCVALLVTALLIPFPLNIKAVTVVEPDPDKAMKVAIADDGTFLMARLVKDGERVSKGQPLLQLENPELDKAMAKNVADRQTLSKSIDEYMRFSKGANTGPLAEQLIKTRAELDQANQEEKFLQDAKERLVVRAPQDGVVMRLVPNELVGQKLPLGAVACTISEPADLRSIMLVSADDYKLIEVGQEAAIRIHGRGYNYWKGTVASIANAEAKEIPQVLSSKVGGDVATKTEQNPQAAETGQQQMEKPQSQHYMVTIRMEEMDDYFHPGVMGKAKIYTKPRTMFWRLSRFFNSVLNWSL